jgi:hypothetical protein
VAADSQSVLIMDSKYPSWQLARNYADFLPGPEPSTFLRQYTVTKKNPLKKKSFKAIIFAKVLSLQILFSLFSK